MDGSKKNNKLMRMQKLLCYPRYQILERYYADIEKDPRAVVISISSTTDHRPLPSELGIPDTEDKVRCLRLKFDDIGPESNCRNAPSPRAMTEEEGEVIVEFIEKNIDANFYIHCDAGQSRSQAVVRFILECYGEGRKWQLNPTNPPDTPNIYVLSTLKRILLRRCYGGDIKF